MTPVPIKGRSRRNSKRKGAARRAAARRRRWAASTDHEGAGVYLEDFEKWLALGEAARGELTVAFFDPGPRPTPDEVEDLKRVLAAFHDGEKGVTAMPGLREAQEAADADELPGTPVELGGYLDSLPRRRPGRFTYEDTYPHGPGVVIPLPAE